MVYTDLDNLLRNKQKQSIISVFELFKFLFIQNNISVNMFITDNISLIGHTLSTIFSINTYETLSVHNFAVSKAYGNFIYIFFLNEKPSSHSIYDRY